VNTEDRVIDDGGKGQGIEHPVHILPYLVPNLPRTNHKHTTHTHQNLHT
jgi:hypothetical protein